MIVDKYASHEMNEECRLYCDAIRHKVSSLDDYISGIEDSREKSLAMTKLEECLMWANKAIALHGLKGFTPKEKQG